MAEKNATKIEISTSTIIKGVLILAGIWLLYFIRDIVFLFLIAITLASALEPLVSSAREKLRLPRGLTVFLVYIVILGSIGLFFYYLTPVFADQFKTLASQYQNITENVVGSAGPLQEFIRDIRLDDAIATFLNTLSGGRGTGEVFSTTIGFLTGLLEILAVLVISFYLVVEQKALRQMITQNLPDDQKSKAMRAVDAIQRKLGFWLVGQFLLSLTIFVVTFIALSALGVKYALALAAIAGLLEIIPFLGPIIAAIPAILVAFTQSPTLAIAVVVLYVLIQKMENYILVPKIMEKTVGVHPLAVLMAALIGFKLAGIIGALLAVPVVAAASVLFDVYIANRTPYAPSSADQVLKTPLGKN